MTLPVFLSYSHRDRATIARIASDLRALDVPVWWDKWELKVGDSLTTKIEEGIQSAGYLCLALSQHSIQSNWVQRELTAGLVRELEDKRVFVLPLLLEECRIPLFIRDKLYADFTASYEEGFGTLVERIAPRIDPVLCAELMNDDLSRIEASLRRIPEKNKSTYIHWLRTKLLSDVNAERRAAVTGLFYFKVPGIAGHLIALAKDESASVRRLVALYLGNLRVAAGSSTLHELTLDKALEVRATARDALEKLG